MKRPRSSLNSAMPLSSVTVAREVFVERLVEELADLEAIIRIAREAGQHRGQAHLAFHAAIARRLAEQVRHSDARLHVAGPQPAFDRLVGQDPAAPSSGPARTPGP